MRLPLLMAALYAGILAPVLAQLRERGGHY
jgi:hypothetical protein